MEMCECEREREVKGYGQVWCEIGYMLVCLCRVLHRVKLHKDFDAAAVHQSIKPGCDEDRVDFHKQ